MSPTALDNVAAPAAPAQRDAAPRATSPRSTSPRRTAGAPRNPRPGRPSRRAGDLAALVAGLGAGLTLAISLPVVVTGWNLPGGIANGLGILTAMLGTYAALLGCLLMARLPWIEREVGQDRLIAWHRQLGPYALVLIVAHVILTTLGYGQAVNASWLAELVQLTFGSAWMLPAMAATLLMVALGVLSWRRIRSRMKYETWHTMHLYFYLAIVLAFGHQIEAGSVFAGHPLAEGYWIALYVVVGAAILVWRVLLPSVRTLRHGVRVTSVEQVDAQTVHVHMSGRHLDRLRAQGGQWFTWRFGTRSWWWQGHPYSLSASPTDTTLRITVKDLGDQSGALTMMKPGTRVLLEGPYGAFRMDRRETDHVVLIGAGVGITPIRALLDELPAHARATVLYRVHAEPVPLADEFRALEDASHGRVRVHFVIGSRQQYPLNPRQLRQAVPDIADSDVFLCGPSGFVDAVQSSAERCGVPARRIHHELFEF